MELVFLLANVLNWAFSIYVWVIVISFVLGWIQADPFNPVVRFITGVTHPLWHRVEALSPPVLKPMAPFVALVLAVGGGYFFPGLVRSLGGMLLGEIGLADGALSILVYLAFAGLMMIGQVLYFILVLSVVWFIIVLAGASVNNPIARSVMIMLDPFLVPIQRVLPRIGIDLSPLVLAALAYLASRYAEILALKVFLYRAI